MRNFGSEAAGAGGSEWGDGAGGSIWASLRGLWGAKSDKKRSSSLRRPHGQRAFQSFLWPVACWLVTHPPPAGDERLDTGVAGFRRPTSTRTSGRKPTTPPFKCRSATNLDDPQLKLLFLTQKCANCARKHAERRHQNNNPPTHQGTWVGVVVLWGLSKKRKSVRMGANGAYGADGPDAADGADGRRGHRDRQA